MNQQSRITNELIISRGEDERKSVKWSARGLSVSVNSATKYYGILLLIIANENNGRETPTAFQAQINTPDLK